MFSLTPATSPLHHGAAVAIMNMGGVRSEGARGLARLVQISPEQCVIEGTIDGLRPGERHALCVHQYGDLSEGLVRSDGWEGELYEGHLKIAAFHLQLWRCV